MRRIWDSIARVTRARNAPSRGGAAGESVRNTQRRDAALSYKCRLSLRHQRARLNTLGPYIWVDRDSDWYPDYISTRCYPDYGFFKIFDEGDGQFNLSIKLVTDAEIVEAELAKLQLQARELVLSVIDAEEIQPAEPYD